VIRIEEVNMGTAFAYGLGTTIDDLELRKDAASRFFDLFTEKRQKRFVADWRKNYPQLDWDDAMTIMMITEGTEKVIADVINENCFGGKKIVTGQKGAIYAEPYYPKSDSARGAIPLEKDIRDAIAVHLQACYKGVRKRDIGYYFFEDEDDD
jgi:hypothetical protein